MPTCKKICLNQRKFYLRIGLICKIIHMGGGVLSFCQFICSHRFFFFFFFGGGGGGSFSSSTHAFWERRCKGARFEPGSRHFDFRDLVSPASNSRYQSSK